MKKNSFVLNNSRSNDVMPHIDPGIRVGWALDRKGIPGVGRSFQYNSKTPSIPITHSQIVSGFPGCFFSSNKNQTGLLSGMTILGIPGSPSRVTGFEPTGNGHTSCDAGIKCRSIPSCRIAGIGLIYHIIVADSGVRVSFKAYTSVSRPCGIRIVSSSGWVTFRVCVRIIDGRY